MSIKGQGQPKSAHAPPVCLASHNAHSVNYIIPRFLVFACTYEEQLDYVPENLGMISSWG